jgi:hypothetical protein
MGHALGNNYGNTYSFLSKPVALSGHWTVDNTQPTGTSNIVGQAIKQVYMHSSAPGLGNPNPAIGTALIQFNYNYTKFAGGGFDIGSPVTGSALAINSTALTIGSAYQIVSSGVGAAGAETISPVADVSGSLASKYFSLYDSYGNTFILWFSVSGVGSAPVGVSGSLYQVSIATNSSAATVGAALVTVINNLPSGTSGVFSFTASGTTTVTVTSTTNLPLNGVAADGISPLNTGFTFALTVYNTNLIDWQGVGVPKGIAPVPGVGFVATATGVSTGGGSTGTVKAIGLSGVAGVEFASNPNYTLNPIPMSGSPNVGGYMLINFNGATSSSVTTPILVAPAQFTVVYMDLLVEQASVLVAGE